MSANIKINIVEPSPTPTPINPSNTIDPAVPNTGLFGNGIGTTEATVISISIVALLAIAAVIVAVLYRKHQKQGKVTKLVHTIDQCKTVIKSKKRITASLAALALLASIGTFATLLTNASRDITNAAEGTETTENTVTEVEGNAEGALTLDVSSEELTIEVGDEPVFAVLPVELTAEEATEAGYTLTAYTEDTNLVSTTDSTKIIPMVTVDEGDLVALADNTYGLALDNKPASKDNEVYTALSTDADNPTFITDKDYEGTGENDKTTIYYGFYITPDTPKGTYEGSEITYSAEANRTDLATVTFDGNGLYYDGKESKTKNIVRYEAIVTDKTNKYSHTPNVTDEGIQEGNVGYKNGEVVNQVITIPNAASLKVELTYGGGFAYNYYMGWASMWQGSHPNYTARNDYSNTDSITNCGGGEVTDGRYSGGDTNTTVECNITGDSVTFAYYSQGGGPGSGPTYGYYAIVTGYDANGDIVYLKRYEPFIGGYQNPDHDESEVFLGWSIDPQATSAEYITEYEVTKYLIPTMSSATTLYAVWSPVVSFNYDGNDATAGSMESTSYNGDEPTTVTLAHEDVIVGNTINLYAPNYKKTGYGFVGWSTDQNAWDNLTDDNEANDPTIYGPNQTFTVTKDMAIEAAKGKDTLYAIWAPAETENGSPVALQNWTGCSNLAPSTYDTETGTLTVGKNTITALTDDRDGNVYTIVRLADGNCWMTENLRLNNEATISTTNTNNPLTVDNNVAIKNNDGNTYNHLSPNSNSWCKDENADCYNQSYLNTFNTNLGGQDAIASYNGNYDDEKAFQWYSYGNNYNWYSATAGNGTYNTGEQGPETAVGDICPAGWMLPIGNETTANGSFSNLDSNMGGTGSFQSTTEASNKWRSFPNNFVYSGQWYDSSASVRGDFGGYLSSTAFTSHYIYKLSFSGNMMWPGDDNGFKGVGYSVRCVAPVQ